MKIFDRLLAATAIATALAAMPASAATFTFTSAAYNLAFTIPDSPTTLVAVIPGEIFGVPTDVSIDGAVPILQNVAFTSLEFTNGGFSYDGSYGKLFTGALLYSGSETAPTFVSGTYTLTSVADSSFGTLVISPDGVAAVPETATWAMMLAGFGMIGFASRRRTTVKPTVTYV